MALTPERYYEILQAAGSTCDTEWIDLWADYGEQGKQLERVREVTARARAYAKEFELMASDARARGNPTLARREQSVADEVAEWADRYQKALDGGEPAC